MPRFPAHLRERALGKLQGGMRTADMARAIHCNVHTVRRLRQCYRETGQTADHPRSGRPRVTPAQDRYRIATTTARITPGTHNPSISAQTVRNWLREAGLRACRPCKAGPHQTSPTTMLPMGTNPMSLDQTGLAESALH